ncbi:unnamed protein product [Sphagnum jensenii]|uniref:Flavin-containing monooxygenase n=1 Tax=Sphagnum jensenii TaxID=128206 RepID=A0ABP1BIU3_9BRYO
MANCQIVDQVHKCCKVGVIGAGAAGLATAKELIREGHKVTVFEQAMQVGGLWVYDPQVDSDLLGVEPHRKRVHSSMYASLRTNLPREVMSFIDFPFLTQGRDERCYPSHKEVALYLENFAKEFDLLHVIQFGTLVEHVELVTMDSTGEKRWKVITTTKTDGVVDEVKEELFDAVVVCSGHYFEPKIANIPGINNWPGKQMHSHNYRLAQPFTNQCVVIIGTQPSGMDISRDVANVAKEVHLSGRSWNSPIDFAKPMGQHQNIWPHSTVIRTYEDGTVKFQDGSSTMANVIVHCTGYRYYYPFLDTKGLVTAIDIVKPVYQHVFPPSLAPSLSFVGLTHKVLPFPLFQLQAKWIAMVFSGKVKLPPTREMMESIEAFYDQCEASGKPMHQWHDLGDIEFQYLDWLADQSGSEHLESWRSKMKSIAFQQLFNNPNTYRDHWPDEDLHQEALLSLRKLEITR